MQRVVMPLLDCIILSVLWCERRGERSAMSSLGFPFLIIHCSGSLLMGSTPLSFQRVDREHQSSPLIRVRQHFLYLYFQHLFSALYETNHVVGVCGGVISIMQLFLRCLVKV